MQRTEMARPTRDWRRGSEIAWNTLALVGAFLIVTGVAMQAVSFGTPDLALRSLSAGLEAGGLVLIILWVARRASHPPATKVR